MQKIKVVFMGTDLFSLNVVKKLKNENYDIVAIVSQPNRAKKRNGQVIPTAIAQFAIDHNIPLFQKEKIRNDYQFIFDFDVDLIITASYGQIIPVQFLNHAKIKAINVHASLLPAYRGGAPLHRAIINGDKIGGVSIMEMVEKMDAGKVFAMASIDISLMNVIELRDALSDLGGTLLIDTLPSIICGENKGVDQDESKVSFAYNIKPEETLINWHEKAEKISCLVRGLAYWPSSYTTLNQRRFLIQEVSVIDNDSDNLLPGTIFAYNKKIAVKCKDGAVVIEKIQPEGKKTIDGVSFYNGYKNIIGGVFS